MGVLQDFWDEHIEIEGSLNALKRKKEGLVYRQGGNNDNNASLIRKLSAVIFGNKAGSNTKKSDGFSISNCKSKIITLKRARTYPPSKAGRTLKEQIEQRANRSIRTTTRTSLKNFSPPRIVTIPL